MTVKEKLLTWALGPGDYSKARFVPSKGFGGDKALWIILLLLGALSVLVIYSATGAMAFSNRHSAATYYLVKQLVILAICFVTVFLVHLVDYRFYFQKAWPLFWICVFFMLLTYAIGMSENDAQRWIRIPIIGFTVQPSDFVKISLAVVLARELARRQENIRKLHLLPPVRLADYVKYRKFVWDYFRSTTWPLLGVTVIAAGIVLKENFSTAFIMVVIGFVMLILGRVRYKQIFRVAVIGLVVGTIVVALMYQFDIGRAKTWVSRIKEFTTEVDTSKMSYNELLKYEDKQRQKEESKIAVASGRWIGKGPGNSTQRARLPLPYSDFAYAFIIEEYGIVGGAAVLVLYLWLISRALVIFNRSKKKFPGLLALGLAFMLTFQALFNMGVAVGLLPITGQPMPLISKGGSAAVFACIAIGIIIGISRQTDEENAAAEQAMPLTENSENNGQTESDT